MTGPLSVVGSAIVIHCILYDRRNHMKDPFHRLILGLSVFDFIASLGLTIFARWAMPQEAAALSYGARGNDLTCTLSGIFTQFLAAPILYMAALSVYFALKIGLDRASDKYVSYYEPLSHVFITMFTLTISTNAVIQGYYHPLDQMSGRCAVTVWPPGCDTSDEVQCIGKTHIPQQQLVGVLISLAFVIISVGMLFVVFKVWKTERQMRSYGLGSQAAVWRSGCPPAGTHRGPPVRPAV